jgi:hypothetical protein
VGKLLFGLPTVRSAPQTACLLALGLALLGFASAQAQNPSPPAARQTEPWQLPPEDRPAAPDVYLLPDETGKLRQVLGFRYEDFLRAWNNRAAGAAAGPPRYAIDQLDTSGTAGDSLVQLKIEVRVTTHVDGWIDVPLELPNLIVQQVEFDRRVQGECLVFDTQRALHVAWLQGRAGQQRKIVLTGSMKMSSSIGNSGLEIALPHATVSQFKLSVPTADAQFEASPEVELTTSSAGQQSEVQLRGYANPLRVEWSLRQEPDRAEITTLESRGEIMVEVDRRRALYAASLKLNSFGNPLGLARVRLPAGATLTQVKTPHELQAMDAETEDAEGGIIEVRLQHPTSEPWVLELVAEQPLEENDAASLCRIGGFEVLGAVRQSGQLTLAVDDQLQAYFDLAGDLEQAPLKNAGKQGSARSAIAAFAYTRFPWTLSVHTLTKQRRVNVEPRYTLQLNPDEARLEIEFDYQFSGARTFAVRVDLRGWQLTDDPLESGGAVEASRVVETEQGLLVLPLVNPDVQRARIALVVRKPIELGEQTFELPEALGGFVLPGQLLVRTDPSLQVATDVSSLDGLGAWAATEQEKAAGDDSPLMFRTFLSRASLGAEITRRQQQVTVDVHTRVDVGETQLAVRQQFDYLVRYRPLAQLVLLAPKAIPDQQVLKVLLDGKEVAATPATDEATGEQSAPHRLVVSLPRPVQDSFRLELTYEFPYAGATPESPAQVSLPLVVAADPLSSHEVTVRAKQPWRIALGQKSDAGSWVIRQEDSPPGTTTPTWHLHSASAESTLPLLVQMDSREDLLNAILERAWLQSWVVGNRQQDRAVFQFRSPHGSVHVELPPAAADQPLEVLLDGEAVEYEPPNDGQLSLALPHVSPRAHHVLEVRYQRPASLLSGGTLRTALPKLVCRPVSAPVFWQLVLPRGWHVVQSPAGLTSESWLGWKAYRWGRQPTRTHSDLEQWSGATPTPPPPPTASQYLYSSFEFPTAVDVTVGRQIWLILATTLATFAIGLLCVYTPIAGRFSFWLGLTLALLALVFAYPEVTLLAGQAILWGGAMTLAALVLKRAFVGRAAAEAVLSPASSLSGSTSATESWDHKQRITAEGDDQPTVAARTEGSKF